MKRSSLEPGQSWRTAVVPVRLEGESYRLAHEACHNAALVWNWTVDHLRHHWKTEWRDPSNRELRDILRQAPPSTLKGLHAHTKQHLVDDIEDAVHTYRTNRDNGDADARAPWRHHNYRPLEFTKGYGWRLSADGRAVILSRGVHEGRRLKPITIPAPTVADPTTGEPVPPEQWGTIQLCWNMNRRRWTLHIAVPTRLADTTPAEGRVMAVDEGIINPMACAVETDDAYEILVVNGREARAARQYRDTRIDKLLSQRARCRKNSRRWRLLDAEIRRLRAIAEGRVLNVAHQASRKVADFAIEHSADGITAGDVRGIEQGTSRRKRGGGKHRGKTNAAPGRRRGRKIRKSQRRRLSQWNKGKTEDLVEHKTGMTVEHINEAYSSQTCPACLTRNRPHGRHYHCAHCGFTCHRDAVGALNILMRAIHGHYRPIDMDKPIHVTYLRATPLRSPEVMPPNRDSGTQAGSRRTAHPRNAAPANTPQGKTPAIRSKAGPAAASHTILN